VDEKLFQGSGTSAPAGRRDNPDELWLAVDTLKQRDDFLAKHVKKGVERLPEEVRSLLM
jgi:hypothetical protein